MISKCNRCFKRCDIVCIRCKAVSYCCKKCQHSDEPMHKQICHISLNARLMALCRVAVKYKRIGRDGHAFIFNLSSAQDIYTLPPCGDVRYRVCAFNIDSITYCCVICEAKIYFKGPYQLHEDVCFEGNKIKYYKCRACSEKKLVLCPNTLLETGFCRRQQEEIAIQSIFFLKYMNESFIIIDLQRYIMNLLMHNLPCKECK